MPTDKISLEGIRAALTSAGDPWEAGVTSLSALPVEEQRRRLGATPLPAEPGIEEVIRQGASSKEAIRAAALQVGTAPAAYDLRNVGGQNFITPVKDQSNCRSCVAFGVVATVEGTLRVQRGDPNLAVDLSEAHLYCCHGRARGVLCTTGWMPAPAFDDFRNIGVVDESCYPYNLSNTDCSGLCSDWAARVTKIAGVQDLTSNVAQIKEWISTRGPVSACFVVYQDFYSYRSGVYHHVTGGNEGGHCVSIVGYNDTLGCWICKNSWGPGWGDRGFFCIAYGECSIETWSCHGVLGIENTGWQSNRQVMGLWAIDQDRNAFAYFAGIGWRKISPDNDNIFFDMLTQLIAAKAAARPVNFYEENGIIKQIYVL